MNPDITPYLAWAKERATTNTALARVLDEGYDPGPLIRDVCLRTVSAAIRSEARRRWGVVSGDDLNIGLYDTATLYKKWRLEERASPKPYAFEVADMVSAACTRFQPATATVDPGQRQSVTVARPQLLPPGATVSVGRIQRWSTLDGGLSTTAVVVNIDLGPLGEYTLVIDADVSDTAYNAVQRAQNHGRLMLP